MKNKYRNAVLLSFDDWIAAYRLSSGMARKLLFNRKKNGLAAAVIRIGSKIFIDPRSFNKWLDRRREIPQMVERQTQRRKRKWKTHRRPS